MVSVAAPMSRGRLTVVSGLPSRAARSRAARPSGPEKASAARPSRARRSRSRVAGLSGRPPGPGAPQVHPPRQVRRRRPEPLASASPAPGPAGLAAAGSGWPPGSAGAVRAGVVAGAVGEQEGLGEPVQGGPVHVPGHHRHHRRITRRGLGFRAGEPARLGRPRGRPGILGRRPARHAPQLGQRHMHQHLSQAAPHAPAPSRPGSAAGRLPPARHGGAAHRCGCPPARPSSPAPPAPRPRRRRTPGSGPPRHGQRRGR